MTGTDDAGTAPRHDAPDGEGGAYATSTSCVQGGELEFRFLDGPAGPPPRRTVVITHEITAVRHEREVPAGSGWVLAVPAEWDSGLYRADFPSCGGSVWFVVRAAHPGERSPILVPLPFATWQAYNNGGEPGRSLYWTEQPDRAHRVTFDRPGGGPPPERWEEGLMRWLHATGRPVDYCSNIDLHLRPELLRHYRLLICNGHDEYWTWEMRDAVEEFVAGGGNFAVFGANTCWWQMRLEDNGRTMVCYRDPHLDPMAEVDPRRVTTEWSSEIVGRPENSLTGLSFRRGAGCWTDFDEMYRDAFEVAFADHWVFAGTDLADGDAFARGALGYETDAADIAWHDGVPRATGHDGTPASFVVLATADLRRWRAFGQGGWATMGVFTAGRGSVFNAGTINWGRMLADPVVDRVTRNVIERFTSPPDSSRWDTLGPAPALRCMVASGTRLFGIDDTARLWSREITGQNISWDLLDSPPPDISGFSGYPGFPGIPTALAAPRETMGGFPQGLYALSADGGIFYRDADPAPAAWSFVGRAPAECDGLAACHEGLFAHGDGILRHLPFALLPRSRDGGDGWTVIGGGPPLRALSAAAGRLYALTHDDQVLSRLPVPGPSPWRAHGPADGCVAFAAHAGTLIGRTASCPATLRRRFVLGPGSGTGHETPGPRG